MIKKDKKLKTVELNKEKGVVESVMLAKIKGSKARSDRQLDNKTKEN